MSRRPVIGVSSRKIYFTHNDRPYPRFGVSMHYVQAVEAAGGVPMILPLTQNSDVLVQLLDVCDGLLLTGGFDIDPSWYGEEPHRRIEQINPLRDVTEMILTREALSRDMPTFGICRGMQVLNVAAGGTLIQDIESQMGDETLLHFQKLTEEYPSHSIEIMENSWLHHLVGETKVRVNSYHHQCVKEPAPGFHVTAKAPDGVAEAMASEKHTFARAVQWHPELTFTNLDFNLALFRSHVEAAGRFYLKRAGQEVR
ncbi:MAG TPA: gamma-glutamyl-gamma-aminobutyrate hydrolase family protein [Planctomycetes bacterium]|nr:gamma-glutamyl-gamma-aminobutyrate hydrolase family protein [Planctomycetota bacterium]